MMKWTCPNRRVIHLLTPNEYDALPMGTPLIDIFGREYIKHQKEIDPDTRGGHLAFGVDLGPPRDRAGSS